MIKIKNINSVILRRVTTVIICCILTISFNMVTVFAMESEQGGKDEFADFTEVTSEDTYNEFDLEWKFNAASLYDMLVSVTDINNNVIAEYSYDDNFMRTSKICSGVETQFVYDDNACLASVSEEGKTVVYHYAFYENSKALYIDGFEYENQYYELVYEDGIIAGISQNGQLLAKYEYGDAYTFEGTYAKDENGEWYLCGDKSFIGNVNKVRYVQVYYDDETDWYYMGRYYSPEESRYIDGYSADKAEELLEEYGPRAIIKCYEYALPYMGISMSARDSSGPIMNTMQVVARVIYAEAGNSVDDQHAVAWVVYNREVAQGKTAYEVVTSGAFAAYNNESYLLFDYSTSNQNEQDKWLRCSSDAYYLVIGKTPTQSVAYINSQIQFRSVKSFVAGYSADAASGKQYFYSSADGNTYTITNVAIPGEMKIEPTTTNVNYNYNFEYNIYFDLLE